MPRFRSVPIPSDKERYYDEAAREKRVLRAKKSSEPRVPVPPLLLPPLRTVVFSNTTDEEEDALARQGGTALQDRLDDPKWVPMIAYRSFEWLSEPEIYANELWKRRVLDVMDSQIAGYEQRDPSLLVYPTAVPMQPCSSPAALCLFQIPEIVEIILRFASCQVQLVACEVSTMWRDTVKHIVNTMSPIDAFRTAHPCGPVQYDDPVDENALDWLQPSDEESKEYEKDLTDAERHLERHPELDGEIKARFFPGRLIQSPKLSDDLDRRGQVFRYHQFHLVFDKVAHQCRRFRRKGQSYEHLLPTFGAAGGPNQRGPGPLVPRWLDLTQSKINPHLIGRIENWVNVMEVKYGRMEFRLSPDCENIGLSNQTCPLEIGSMFITQPPIKYLRFYVWDYSGSDAMSWGLLNAVGSLTDENGVTIETFLHGIRRLGSDAIDAWLENAQSLRESINNGHWKYDVWGVKFAPSLVVLLSQEDMDEDMEFMGWNLNQWTQAVDQEPRTTRQCQWMREEYMKPPRPISTESDVLPGIYSIGLNEPILQDTHPVPQSRRLEYKKVFEKILAEYVEVQEDKKDCA